MIYDSFGVESICKNCKCVTNWYINGDYPLCKECALELLYELINETKEGRERQKNETIKKVEELTES